MSTPDYYFAKPLDKRLRFITALKIAAVQTDLKYMEALFILMDDGDELPQNVKYKIYGVRNDRYAREKLKDTFAQHYHDEDLLCDSLNRKITERYFRFHKSRDMAHDKDEAEKIVHNALKEVGFAELFKNL